MATQWEGPYQVISVPSDAQRQDETLGTKFKFWYFADGNQKVLFKRGRKNEDWSEKVAAEVAHLLQLPAAEVELAEFEGTVGICSPSFLNPGEQLFHGNELLAGLREGYPMHERYRVAQHTLDAVFSALTRLNAVPTPELHDEVVTDACDQMVGYLLLDALVGNTDRHHENWAVVQRDSVHHLAPTYDHASSLGRNEPTRRIEACLANRDPRVTVESYARRCRSAFYVEAEPTRTIGTLEAFRWAARIRPAAARYWLERLGSLGQDTLTATFDRLPESRISDLHRAFGVKILQINAGRLLETTGQEPIT